jgi:pulcherriminic acid synthase
LTTAATQPTGPDIFSAAFDASPETFYADMLRTYPHYWYEGAGAYVISKYEDVDRILKDQASFSSRVYEWQMQPVHGPTMLEKEGREHTKHRNIVGPALRGRKLTVDARPLIEENSRVLIDSFRRDGTVDLVGQYTSWFPVNVTVDLLGLPKDDLELFQRWYLALIYWVGNLANDEQVTARGQRAKVEFDQYMFPLVAARRQHPGDDLISMLCETEVDGVKLSDVEIKSFISLLLAAGGETTDKAIAKVIRNLMVHPDQLQAVREDRTLIAAALTETLRYSPPVHMVVREATRDVELSHGTVAKGASVYCMLAAANRDPDHYVHPERFDIHRPDLMVNRAFGGSANHEGFGKGIHFCVGSILARVEVEVAINQLLDAMDDIRFAGGVEPAEHGYYFRGLDQLRLEFSPGR